MGWPLALVKDLSQAARHPIKTMLGDRDGRILELAEWYCDCLDKPDHTLEQRARALQFFGHRGVKIAAMAFEHKDRLYQSWAQELDRRIDHFRLVPNKP